MISNCPYYIFKFKSYKSLPLNGGIPLANSYNKHPRDQISHGYEYSVPCQTSGAAYTKYIYKLYMGFQLQFLPYYFLIFY